MEWHYEKEQIMHTGKHKDSTERRNLGWSTVHGVRI